MLFSQLNLSAPLLKAIQDEGYTTPTPVQEKAIPPILEGRDMLAGAQTGTGKTAGFTLPILELLSQKPHSKDKPLLRVLILTPTRELAAQVGESVKAYGKYLPFKSAVIFGGVGIQPQIQTLRAGIDILVATPGRLLDHVSQGTIDLRHIETFVLDEATSVCFEEWSKEHTFYCHFTPMEIDEGLYGDTIFVCKHCGHTVDIYGIKIHV